MSRWHAACDLVLVIDVGSALDKQPNQGDQGSFFFFSLFFREFYVAHKKKRRVSFLESSVMMVRQGVNMSARVDFKQRCLRIFSPCGTHFISAIHISSAQFSFNFRDVASLRPFQKLAVTHFDDLHSTLIKTKTTIAELIS